jgi:acyl carrier protein
MDETENIVRSVVANIALPVSRDGAFGDLDSLSVVTFVTELERAAGIRFPVELMTRENFYCIESVAAAVRQAR